MKLSKTLVPLCVLFARFSDARLANRQQYSPRFYWLAPKPKRAPKPRPQLTPKPNGPRRRGER